MPKPSKISTILIVVLGIVIPKIGFSQTDSSAKFVFSAYAEPYFSFDLTDRSQKLKEDYIYNHKRNKMTNLNLIFVKGAYNFGPIRANLAIMAGDYAKYNLANEPRLYRHVMEANIGVKLSKSKNIWLDAGVMPSHIGFESAVGTDCWNLTRSLLAENSPYFETGLKLSSVSKNEKWTTAFLLLNGWQKIKRPDGIRKPSYGVQINFKPNDRILVNYSNFLGSDKADSLGIPRLFHNLYAQMQLTNKLDLLVGFDYGTDFGTNNKKFSSWYSPVLISRLHIKTNHTVALRLEHYADPHETIVITETQSGFQTTGVSFNYDFRLSKYILWRIEPKSFYAQNPIFTKSNKPSHSNLSVTTALAFKF